MQVPQVPRVLDELKRDALGRVECVEGPGGPGGPGPSADVPPRRWIRRVAVGGRLPGSGLVARVLMQRERRALERLAGIDGVPRLMPEEELPGLAELAGLDGAVPAPGACLVRSFVEGQPLHLAAELPADFFDHLDALVLALHGRGVCHNDLHKEQNVMVRPDGRPGVIDFQLASVHAPDDSSRRRRAREGDDLRHLQKHRRRYTRDGRGPGAALAGVVAVAGEGQRGAGHGLRRSALARIWRSVGKPLYEWGTRRVLKTRDGEPRRPSSGPWPRWKEPLGPVALQPPRARSGSMLESAGGTPIVSDR